MRGAPIIRYDNALPLFVEIVSNCLGDTGLRRNAFLRDADGILTLVVRDKVKAELRSRLEAEVRERLGNYAAAAPLATPVELMDPKLADRSLDQWEIVNNRFVRLIERRLVGQDWVRGIQPPIPRVPPVVVFASQKGGVGRSTALAVAATEFAYRGKSILAIDLDLEAPGLGGMLLPAHDLPTFGALDYYVENGRGSIDDAFYNDMISISPLARGTGRVLVVPAAGQRCREFPQNVIGKISRAYLEDVAQENGEPKTLTFLDQTRDMIGRLCDRESYDAVFVDARAGLNETTAATIQGLGADVLFFGVDTPQTWEGYRFFLAHLARFKPREVLDGEDWRYRLKMVHAKAAADPKSWADFRDNSFELFSEHLYDELDETESLKDVAFSFDIDDREAPHYAWPILIDPTYYQFDPVGRHEQLTDAIYMRTFGFLIRGLGERVGLFE
jgi:MinD-like ATPase involved in chromosome partitioning or flagellar assembly